MKCEQLENIISLRHEGLGEKAISNKLKMSHGIVGWYLLFIEIHGEESARKFNLRVGRPSYTKVQFLGIHNYVLESKCGYERAEIYFKIPRNKLRARLQKYFGKDGFSHPAPNGVPMEPEHVKRQCYLHEVEANKDVAMVSSQYDQLSEEELAAGAAIEIDPFAPFMDSRLSDFDFTLDKEGYATFSQSLSESVKVQPDKPCIFGRAKEDIKYYPPKKVNRNKGQLDSKDEQALCTFIFAPEYAATFLSQLCKHSFVDCGLYLSLEQVKLMYGSLLNEAGYFDCCDEVVARLAKQEQISIDFIENAQLGTSKTPKKEAFLNIVEAERYFLGEFPARVPASTYNPGSRAPLPRIDTRSEGFHDLPEHHRRTLLDREQTEFDIRKAAAELIELEGLKPLPGHELIKWRYRTASFLIERHPEWKPSTIKNMVGITSRQFNYYQEHPDSLDPYAVIETKFKYCFKEIGKGLAGRRVMAKLLRKHFGIYLAPATVAKLMKKYGLKVHRNHPRPNPYSSFLKGLKGAHPELLGRNFHSEIFGEKIVTDISEMIVCGEKVYLSIYMDLATNMILTATISKSPSVAMVIDGLEKALDKIPDEVITIVHSDQGHHYKRFAYTDVANNAVNTFLSNSRKGNCYDNGKCEGRFSVLKKEMFFGRKFRSLNQFYRSLFNYIAWYNMYRPQICLGGLTPLEKKTQLDEIAMAA